MVVERLVLGRRRRRGAGPGAEFREDLARRDGGGGALGAQSRETTGSGEYENGDRLVAADATKQCTGRTERPRGTPATEDPPAEAVEQSEPSLLNGAQDGQIQVVLPSQNFGVPLRRLVRG